MARKTNDQKAMLLLADMMAKYGEKAGITDTEKVLSEVQTVAELQEAETSKVRNAMAEIEGIIIQQHYVHSFTFKSCKHCGEVFQTNYCYQSYCSPLCRDETLRAHLGLSVSGLRELRMRKPASFWEYEDPITISPETVESLYIFSKMFVEGYDEIKKRALETQTQTTDQSLEDEEDFAFLPVSEEVTAQPEAHSEPSSPNIADEALDDGAQSTASAFDLSLSDLDFDLSF